MVRGRPRGLGTQKGMDEIKMTENEKIVLKLDLRCRGHHECAMELLGRKWNEGIYLCHPAGSGCDRYGFTNFPVIFHYISNSGKTVQYVLHTSKDDSVTFECYYELKEKLRTMGLPEYPCR